MRIEQTQDTAITVRRTKLFYVGAAGEAPAGSTYDFNILEHSEFRSQFGHLSVRDLDRHVQVQIDRWNKMQPRNWRYERV